MDTYYFSKPVFKLLKIVKRPEAKWGLIQKFPVLFFNPHMVRKEYLLFKEVCKDKKVFLEYGSGGSTIYLLKNRKTVYSVESNPDFYKYMSSMSIMKRARKHDLQYKFIELGPTNKWGKPLSTEHSADWPKYYEAIWKDINPAENKVDVVFIDGRFRVCCCLYSILKAVEYNWTDITFLIHDFWRRNMYHVVLDYLQEIKSAENLVAFRIKSNVDINELKFRLKEYASQID